MLSLHGDTPVKAAPKPRGANGVAAKRSQDDERRMDKLIDELYGCLPEGDALAELEREHRSEVLALRVLADRLEHGEA